MTVVYTYLASDNARNRRRAKRAEDREQKQQQARMERSILRALQGSANVSRAVTQAPDWRVRPEKQESAGSICLPEVARYNAGYRTIRKNAVHIVK